VGCALKQVPQEPFSHSLLPHLCITLELVRQRVNRAAGSAFPFGGFSLPPFEHHVFVCHNTRPEGAPRKSCGSTTNNDLHARLQQLTKEAGLGARVRINKSGCLDQCEHGPVMVVYPEAVWYGNVLPADADEIVREHLVGGRPVERLRIADECLNNRNCAHCG